MAITHWKPIRISLLAVTLVGVLLAAGKSILYPNSGSNTTVEYNFPESVPLADWQMVDSVPLKIAETSQVKTGRKYRYTKNSISLEVEMRYVLGTNGDVASMMKGHTILKSSPGKLAVANIPGVGYHGVLQQQNRLYLSSCINPRGGSTVDAEQFRYNRNTQDLRFDRLVFWLLGKGNIQDQRCLWAQMSVSLDRTTPADANKILETAWVSWHQWWQPRFP
ncbi:MAG: cyanoexosortase A system-associated protein [Microcoleus sp. SM1_3_4]|nr:cyanoexosortase A system-associated protein [Microcoleus sp. SM1_3_4]